jgi:hypothetical protein
MTSQTKHFIELSDIVGLHCECKQGTCKTALSIPVSDVEGRELRVCPRCKEPWAQFIESSYEPIIVEFIQKLKRLKEARLGCTLTLEIKAEAMPESEPEKSE